MTPAVPRVLSIAGSDSGGGAGVQADLKTIAAWGGYGMTAITAITAQNTQGVQAVHPLPVDVVRAQLDSVAADIAVDAVKIGMLGTVELMRAVAGWLEETLPAVVVVLDPVMVASSGDALTAVGDDDGRAAWSRLLRAAHLVTPNLPELARLTGRDATDWDAALDAARGLAAEHGVTVLLKGGHLDETEAPEAAAAEVPDAVVRVGGAVHEVRGPRVATRASHGTGCTLSSALATLQARHGDWPRSLRIARDWLRGALEAAGDLDVGHGSGPVHHFHHVQDALESWGTAPERFTDELWEASAAVRREIEELEFVRLLGDGRLEPDRFLAYLDQDLQYLDGYSRALAALAARAPGEEARSFFAAGAVSCTETEAQLHRARLRHAGLEGAGAPAGEVTRRYTTFLLAATARNLKQMVRAFSTTNSVTTA